jgi:hypothetical protein
MRPEDEDVHGSESSGSEPAHGGSRFSVHEYDGVRGSTLHGFSRSYAEARELARRMSEKARDRAFRIVDDGGIVAIAMSGNVTNPSGTGPDRDPDLPPPSNAPKWRPWLERHEEERPQS